MLITASLSDKIVTAGATSVKHVLVVSKIVVGPRKGLKHKKSRKKQKYEAKLEDGA